MERKKVVMGTRELDSDKIGDGDVLKVKVCGGGNAATVWFGLHHRRSGDEICLTRAEVEWILSNM